MRSYFETYRIFSIAAVLELFTVDEAADIMCGYYVSLLNYVATSFLSYCPFVVLSVDIRSIAALYVGNHYIEDE